MDEFEPERWLPVPGYEGLYEVSDLGRVRSLVRRTRQGLRGGRILRPGRNSSGYLTVVLSRDGHCTSHLVHRLVLLAFTGPCPPGMEGLHGPAGKLENCVRNLSYGTSADNKRDKFRDGTHQRGERNGHAKLTPEIVAEARARHCAGESQAALAREFGVRPATMWSIVRYKSWVPVQ